MSMPWGIGIDAELGYRQERVRSDFRRSQSRRAARSTPRSTRQTRVERTESSMITVRPRPLRAA